MLVDMDGRSFPWLMVRTVDRILGENNTPGEAASYCGTHEYFDERKLAILFSGT